MEEFLKKIKLIHNFTTELDVRKEQFVDGFFRNVDQDELHLFFQFTDLFSRSDNLIKGYMKFDKFKLKPGLCNGNRDEALNHKESGSLA